MKKFILIFFLFYLAIINFQPSDLNLELGTRYIYTDYYVDGSINLGVFYETKTAKNLNNVLGESYISTFSIDEIFSKINYENYSITIFPDLELTIYEGSGKNGTYSTFQIAKKDNLTIIGFPYILGSY